MACDVCGHENHHYKKNCHLALKKGDSTEMRAAKIAQYTESKFKKATAAAASAGPGSGSAGTSSTLSLHNPPPTGTPQSSASGSQPPEVLKEL